jgi:DNA polymerase-1
MKIIKTHELTPATMPASETEKLWIYNGLDCCVTNEVLHIIQPQLDNQTRAIYEFSKSLQAPVLEMKLRGVLIDPDLRNRVVQAYQKDIAYLSENLNAIAREGIGMASVNFASPKQLKELFYERLKIPPIKKRTRINGEYTYTPTVDRNALEQLDNYFLAQPLISHILGLRDLAKKVSVLRTNIDSDGRMRTSYNIAGTSTGRFSSSLSDFGTGTNLQNIEDRLRSVFVADPGMKFAYVDLEQAESRLVGAIEWNLFHDPTYLDACESGDLHTSVCQLAWGDAVRWTGRIDEDKKLAEQPFYRQHSFRHMAKVLGHGTNYNGKPHTMSKHTKLDAKLIAEFQSKYFAAFPAHQRWHAHVASELRQHGNLTSLTGRRRWFFGRRDDDSTVREAIAFDPQGSVADILNRGMLNVWRENICQLLLQIHDAILIQYPEDQEDRVVPLVIQAIKVPIELLHGRTLVIPSEAKVGWNWASYSEENPDGLTKWRGADRRTRQRPAPAQLDFVLHSTN